MEDIYYVIAVGHGVKLGVLHSTHAEAERTAKRLRFRYYEVIPYRHKKRVAF